MLTFQFGGVREDIIGALSIVMTNAKASQLVTNAENYVKGQAKAGALQAVPNIQAEVKTAAKTAVKPYVIAALVLGGVGALLGGIALARRKR